MIPKNTYSAASAQTGGQNFRLLEGKMGGLCSGVEALRGWIVLALSTERYAYPIFTSEFGLDCRFGERASEAEIERAIRDALSIDERIRSIDGFTITREGGEVSAAFTVYSVYGSFETRVHV